jgi:hypothetical protein
VLEKAFVACDDEAALGGFGIEQQFEQGHLQPLDTGGAAQRRHHGRHLLVDEHRQGRDRRHDEDDRGGGEFELGFEFHQ